MARAAEAGYTALMLTVDLPLPKDGVRELRHPVLDAGPLGNVLETGVGGAPLDASLLDNDASLTWADLPWIRSLAPMPLVIKGILTPEDARLAVEHGAAAILV